ncbi:YsnF/AvaK domain-containing protein [Dermacoccus nishinomiyaensis]|uniref:DUF2382 domain-containing protein n=2 Tax=Dermacoccus TaxID=57495 RepID=UPI000DFC8B59|nr:PRC and DUF2382 domain-containing protein [Dermacoccus nishinomiyaensis]QQY24427.1 YsnF/AvaK domain-containing protein [Dermacoccus nishinomiyaensis]STD20141.1 Uncharacterized protein conserved in bacteria [Dermacoccus nishinomiyaensis]
MLSVDDVLATRSGKAYDSDGDKIGSVGEVYLDDQTSQPAWVTVNTGLFGTSESFVPLEGARVEGEDLHLPYTKAKIKDAPRQDADKHLDVEQEEALYRYYGLSNGGTTHDGDRRDFDGRDAAAAGTAGTAGYAAGHHDHDAKDRVEGRVDEARADHEFRKEEHDERRVERDERNLERDENGVVLHEERLNVAKERREAGKARLRKYVVTEQQQVDVPVTREEVHVTREPVNERVDGNVQLGEETQTVTLHEERPVVDKETVATERVGLDVDQVQETQRVQAEVGHEEVRVENGVEGTRGTDDVRGTDGVRDGDDRSFADKAKDKVRDVKDNH